MAAKEKKGLGTGLGVLFGAENLSRDDFELKDDEYQQMNLPISKVEPRQEQPRENFDPQALQDLADSIAQVGLIQPIIVRKLDSGYYQIIAGERRWRACRMAGLTEVPVRVIRADDRRTAELALVENLQREDLNPIEEAKGYKTLIDVYGLTQEEAAKSVGRSRPAITNSMRLLQLSDEVLKLVEKGELSAGHARALLSVEDGERQLAAATEVITKSLSVRKTEQLAEKLKKEKEIPPVEEKPTDDINVDYTKQVCKELGEILGRKVNLTQGKKTGKIELEFYDSDDRENLIQQLRNLKIK